MQDESAPLKLRVDAARTILDRAGLVMPPALPRPAANADQAGGRPCTLAELEAESAQTDAMLDTLGRLLERLEPPPALVVESERGETLRHARKSAKAALDVVYVATCSPADAYRWFKARVSIARSRNQSAWNALVAFFMNLHRIPFTSLILLLVTSGCSDRIGRLNEYNEHSTTNIARGTNQQTLGNFLLLIISRDGLSEIASEARGAQLGFSLQEQNSAVSRYMSRSVWLSDFDAKIEISIGIPHPAFAHSYLMTGQSYNARKCVTRQHITSLLGPNWISYDHPGVGFNPAYANRNQLYSFRADGSFSIGLIYTLDNCVDHFTIAEAKPL